MQELDLLVGTLGPLIDRGFDGSESEITVEFCAMWITKRSLRIQLNRESPFSSVDLKVDPSQQLRFIIDTNSIKRVWHTGATFSPNVYRVIRVLALFPHLVCLFPRCITVRCCQKCGKNSTLMGYNMRRVREYHSEGIHKIALWSSSEISLLRELMFIIGRFLVRLYWVKEDLTTRVGARLA